MSPSVRRQRRTPNSGMSLPREVRGMRRVILKPWNQTNSFRHTLSRFGRHLAPHKRSLSIAVACTFGHMFLTLLEPWPVKLILDHVLLDRELPPIVSDVLAPITADKSLLLFLLIGLVLGIAILRGVVYYYREILSSIVGQQTVADIRLELYEHIQSLSFSFHDRKRTGDLITRLTSDIRILRNVLIALPLSAAADLFLIVGMASVMFLMDWRLTLIALSVFPALALVMRLHSGPLKSAIHAQRERESGLATMAAEVLGAIRVVQGFTREREEVRRFGGQNRRSLRSGLKAARLEARFNWMTEIIVAMGTSVVLVVAVQRVLAEALSPGDLIIFVLYLRTFYRPLRNLSRFTERAARGTTSGQRVLDVLETDSKVRETRRAIKAQPFRGDVTFEHVFFKYGTGSPVLVDIDLVIGAGEHVTLLGPSGAGKSTLVSLVPRFYDPTAGVVRIDGTDVRAFTLESLRRQISIVFQEPVLFAASIAENIAHGRAGASEGEIIEASKKAGIHQIISGLPDGYNTILGERGGTLSGGQRQCVAIARSMIRNPRIVLLDEPTSGLDANSAALVLEALYRLMDGRTVLTITHQSDAIEPGSRLIRLSEGRVLEDARDLLLYRALA